MNGTFLTIRKAAVALNLPEFFLRRLAKENKLPGFRSGNRFYVNTEALKKQLESAGGNERL